MRYTVLLGFFTLLLFAPVQARAASSMVVHKTHIFAGPANHYPKLALVRANTGLNLLGCTSGWRWCEIETHGIHGWVPSGNIKVIVYGRQIGVANYASHSWLPLIRFNEPVYWTKYYYDRDFCIKRYGKHHDNRWSQRDCDYRDRSGQCRAWDRHQNDDRDDDHDHDRDYWRDRYQQYNDSRYHSHYNN
ncbi:MAG: hypothetical protein EPN97_05305 [Alphaproteobacteria bacterium]|nr:MAG: hypothetical protein EPN97_05305 [Alphaproteobacteria bacterium]